MSRRPVGTSPRSGAPRMAPGGRMWSESPIRRPYPRVRQMGATVDATWNPSPIQNLYIPRNPSHIRAAGVDVNTGYVGDTPPSLANVIWDDPYEVLDYAPPGYSGRAGAAFLERDISSDFTDTYDSRTLNYSYETFHLDRTYVYEPYGEWEAAGEVGGFAFLQPDDTVVEVYPNDPGFDWDAYDEWLVEAMAYATIETAQLTFRGSFFVPAGQTEPGSAPGYRLVQIVGKSAIAGPGGAWAPTSIGPSVDGATLATCALGSEVDATVDVLAYTGDPHLLLGGFLTWQDSGVDFDMATAVRFVPSFLSMTATYSSSLKWRLIA